MEEECPSQKEQTPQDSCLACVTDTTSQWLHPSSSDQPEPEVRESFLPRSQDPKTFPITGRVLD